MTSVSVETYGKAIVVKGDTRPVKDFLKAKGGKWFPTGSGWMFKGSQKSQLLEDLRSNSSIANVVDRTGSGDQKASTSTSAPDAKQPESPAKRKAEGGDAPASSSSDGNVVDLGGSIHCSVSTFGGTKGVDIRRMWQDGGELKPTAKGVRLNEDEWKALRENAEKITAASKTKAETKVELADLCIVTINSQGGDRIDMRKYYLDKSDGEKKPTKKGVSISLEQWTKLRQSFQSIDATYQETVAEPKERPAKAAKVTATKEKKTKTKEDNEEDASSLVSKATIKKAVTKLLEGKDLNLVTPKVLRRDLEKELNAPEGALDEHKDMINKITQTVMASMQAEEDEE